jgi:hypothetical protein
VIQTFIEKAREQFEKKHPENIIDEGTLLFVVAAKGYMTLVLHMLQGMKEV